MDFSKEFELETKKLFLRLSPELVAPIHRIPDGLMPVKHGDDLTYRHVHKTPGDFLTWRKEDGRLVLIECKSLSAGTSLPVEDDDAIRAQKRGLKKKNATGLKHHQLEALLDLWEDGGVSMLLVAIKPTNEVWLANGGTLRQWVDHGDEKGNRASMSRDHLIAHGYKLGAVERWRWSVQRHHLATRHELTPL